MNRRSRARSSSESGQALVEFALVLPVLVLVLFAIVDVSKAFKYWNDANQLANQAARFAAVNHNPGATSGQTLAQYICTQADTQGLREKLKIAITAPEGATVGNPVKAVADVDYAWMKILDLVDNATTLKGDATMRLEAVPTAGTTLQTSPFQCP